MQGPSNQLCWLDRLVDRIAFGLVGMHLHEMVVVHPWMMDGAGRLAGPALFLFGVELNSSAPLSPACPVVDA